jgi:hypothetical protein
MSLDISGPFTLLSQGPGRIGDNPYFSGNHLTLSCVRETIEMNEPRRDPTHMAAYAPAGLLVLYVFIRLLF